MLLTKDMIRPGIFQKGDNQFLVTSEDVKKIGESVAVLTEAGYRIPLWLEHPSVNDRLAYPVSANDKDLISQAEKDPWFAGWLVSSSLDETEMLNVQLDVPDELGSRLANVGTFVSPQFGRCDSFDKTISAQLPLGLHHLALTRNPVNTAQSRQFVPVKKSENSEPALDDFSKVDQTPMQTRQLSLTEVFSQASELRFSLSDAVINTPGSEGAISGSSSQQAGASGNNGLPIPQSAPQDVEARLKQKLQEALQALGININPDSPVLNDAEGLTRVLRVFADVEGETLERIKNSSGSGPMGSGDPYSEQSTVIAMSKTTETETKPTTPQAPAAPVAPATVAVDPVQFSQMKEALINQDTLVKSQQAQISSLVGLVTSQKKAQYEGRILQLSKTGRITQAQAQALGEKAGVYQFSAGSAETAKSELDIALEIYEGLPQGAVVPLNDPKFNLAQFGIGEIGNLGAETPLSPMTPAAEPSEERVNQIIAEHFPGVNNFDRMGFDKK